MAVEFAYMVGWALGLLGMTALTALVGALSLQMAVGESLKASLSFGDSFKTSFISIAIAVGICAALLLMIWPSGSEISARGVGVLALVGFLVNAGVLSLRVKHPVRGSVSFGRACWLTTVQLAFVGIMVSAITKLVQFMTS